MRDLFHCDQGDLFIIGMMVLNHKIVDESANEGPDVRHDQWDPEKVVEIIVEGLCAKSSHQSKEPAMNEKVHEINRIC